MATRTVELKITIKAIFTVEEGVSMNEVMDEMEYSIYPQQEHGNFVDSEMIDWEVLNSK